ncbi:MAG: ABC transporter ATP-binding protein [Desulfobacter postgatei]|uniref:ABC transporter ATP-binding protein n=1 Tax=Desulfobacter postgatei TaxID=2293 RepID=UPI0023F2996D|nr:ABC transporter ATP-binding protein [Desulfobacter postgatei]MDD4273863.1 ABC transporter ATP-binding protein [Desulfobacter postgatei]
MGQSDCSAMRRPILDIQHLKKYFPVTSGVFMRRTGNVHAVDDISFSVFKGESLGIVGESGCGKSTLGRCIMGLYPLTQGRILLDGKPLSAMTRKMRKTFSTRAQMIFQDPFESLNPRQTVRQILEEKFRIHGVSQQETAMQIELLLDQVGLDPGALTKYPHEFSGGQRQRIGIARAISMTPQIVICDEPVSALDVSVQAKILNLLLDLQSALGLTYLFISHDLSVVRHMSDRIIVMYLGRIMEIANSQDIYNHPTHPYTKALLEAVPVADPDRPSKRTPLQGEIPSAENPPRGCRFSSRCPVARSLCFEKAPTLSVCSHDPAHLTACHYPLSD